MVAIKPTVTKIIDHNQLKTLDNPRIESNNTTRKDNNTIFELTNN